MGYKGVYLTKQTLYGLIFICGVYIRTALTPLGVRVRRAHARRVGTPSDLINLNQGLRVSWAVPMTLLIIFTLNESISETLRSSSTSQIHRMCIPIDQTQLPQQLMPYKNFRFCQVIGDQCLSVTITRTVLQLIVSEARKTCITGNLGKTKTINSFPTKLLYYKFSIGDLVTRQTQLTMKASLVSCLF